MNFHSVSYETLYITILVGKCNVIALILLTFDSETIHCSQETKIFFLINILSLERRAAHTHWKVDEKDKPKKNVENCLTNFSPSMKLVAATGCAYRMCTYIPGGLGVEFFVPVIRPALPVHPPRSSGLC